MRGREQYGEQETVLRKDTPGGVPVQVGVPAGHSRW